MGKAGTVQVDGQTYYSSVLWEALVQQATSVGIRLNEQRIHINRLHAEQDALRTKVSDLEKELDFALEQLDDAVQRVIDFQRGMQSERTDIDTTE